MHSLQRFGKVSVNMQHGSIIYRPDYDFVFRRIASFGCSVDRSPSPCKAARGKCIQREVMQPGFSFTVIIEPVGTEHFYCPSQFQNPRGKDFMREVM